MANNRIRPDEIGQEVTRILDIYSRDVQDGVADITEENTRLLVKLTKKTAPIGGRNGQYKKNITGNFRDIRQAKTLRKRKVQGIWYVKAPDYRLTHLLVYGHATRDGDRTTPNPFLQNAVDVVIPKFEQEMEALLRNGN